MSWASYWARVWEPRQPGRLRPPVAEADGGRADPVAASRSAPRSRGRRAARHDAASRLQGLLGNRALVRMAGPLPGAAPLGSALGADLSDVRVYEDPLAAAAIGARAFATRDEVVVADADAVDDPALMRAEAAHVAQARRRGVTPGISRPGDASEREAHGEPLAPSSGGPVPAIQRQADDERPTVSIGQLQPQIVRTMLEMQFRVAADAEHGVPWSPELEAAFARLLPTVDMGRIRALWDPPPPSAGVAFLRLVDAGIFPTLTPAPQEAPPPAEAPPVAEPVEQPEPDEPADELDEEPVGTGTEVAVRPSMAMGIAGINIRIGRPPPMPPEAVVAAPLLQRGIRLTDAQLRSAMASRDSAAQVFSNLLGTIPGLDEPTRLALALWMADMAVGGATRAEARLSRPTPLEADAAATARFPRPRPPSVLDALPQVAPLPQLLDSLAGVGVTVTISFDL